MTISPATSPISTGRRFGPGFTILELIVALSVTVLMLVMISALFTATSDGVSMGMALSDVIGAGRAIGDQLERDANQQHSPVGNPAGVLVIVCQKFDNIPYRLRRNELTRAVRSDQFMFTRDFKGASKFPEEPITPIDNSTFASPTRTQMANVRAIRVWYGHVLKTNETGTSVTGFGAIGRNKLANEWALGRHALFLVGDGATAGPPAFNHSKGAFANATTAGLTVPGGTSLFHGGTDVAYLEYSDATKAAGTFLGESSAGAGGAFANQTLWYDLGKAGYDARALGYMFLGANRIWANPFPRINPLANTTWATAGQIAQMHPLLMDNVSDFIVEFAADAVDDSGVPNLADGFDGEPDRDSAGETIWYGLENNPDTNSAAPPSWNTRGVMDNQSPTAVAVESPVVTASLPAGTVAYVFRHGAGHDKLWPYMIRIRYRVHDVRGDLLGDKSFEKGDTLPDGTGTNSGRWFEQIIKVKRE